MAKLEVLSGICWKIKLAGTFLPEMSRWFGEAKEKKEGFHPRARVIKSKWLEGARSSILEGIKL